MKVFNRNLTDYSEAPQKKKSEVGLRRETKYERNLGKCVGINYSGPTASNRI